MTEPRQRWPVGPRDSADAPPPHAEADVPWDRPAELPWPEPELDAITWNERWNVAAYDPDYPLPPSREEARARQAVTVGAAAGPPLRFGRPIRAPEDVELDDPYDEYAPVADDLQAPGQLTWTGGTVPLRPVAQADARSPSRLAPAGPAQLPPPQPRPAVEPPTWSRTSRSVFGDYFAGSAGQAPPSLPSPERDVAQAAAVEAASEPSAPADEWPPVPAVFQPQWASVAPVQPAWSAPTVPKPGRTPPVPPTWVGSPPRTVNRLPSPPPPSPLDPAVGYVAQPPLTPAAVAVGVAAVTLPAARPLAPVRPVIPARPIPTDPAPVLPDEYDLPAVDAATAEDADSEVGGPSTVSTLFWMAVTGVVVVGLVLAFLHLMTGVFR